MAQREKRAALERAVCTSLAKECSCVEAMQSFGAAVVFRRNLRMLLHLRATESAAQHQCLGVAEAENGL